MHRRRRRASSLSSLIAPNRTRPYVAPEIADAVAAYLTHGSLFGQRGQKHGLTDAAGTCGASGQRVLVSNAVPALHRGARAPGACGGG